MNFPMYQNWLFITGIVLFILVCSYGIILVLKQFWSLIFYKKADKNNKKSIGCFGLLIRLLIISTLFWFSIAVIALASFTHSFQRLTEQKLIADIICDKTDYDGYSMRITIIQKFGKHTAKPVTANLHGEKWFVEGDILKWSDWVNFLGFDTMYRITKIGGEYWLTENRLQHERTIINLVEDEIPLHWKWLYDYGYSLPFIQDVYSLTISKPPAKGKLFKLYITPSGFTTETIDWK